MCVKSSYIQHGAGASSVRHLRCYAVGHAAYLTLQERSQDGKGYDQVLCLIFLIKSIVGTAIMTALGQLLLCLQS